MSILFQSETVDGINEHADVLRGQYMVEVEMRKTNN